MLMFQQNNLSEAKKILLNLGKKFPSDPNVFGNLALVYLRENNFIHSIDMFQKSLKIDPYNYGVLKNYINFLQQSKNWVTFLSLYKEYETIKINNEMSLMLNIFYAVALRETGSIDKALDIYEKLVSTYPDNLDVIISYGYSLNKVAKYKLAIKIYKKGLRISRDNLLLNYNIGIAYSNIKEYVKSNEFLFFASSKKPSDFGIWITMASNYVNLNDIDNALSCIEKCKKIDPSNYLINYQLAYINSHTGNRKKSIELIKMVLEQDPKNIEANFFLGILYLESEMYTKVMAHYKYRLTREKNRFGMFDDFNLQELTKFDDLLIAHEQGIGDQLLFLRLINSLDPKVKSITYITEPRLEKIIKKEYKNINVINEEEYIDNKIKYEKFKKINLASIINYIDVKKSLSNLNINLVERKYSKNKIKIGISWKSNAIKDGIQKSMKLDDLVDILKIENYEIINLQYGEIEDEVKKFEEKYGIKINYDKNIDYSNDFEKLSELINDCDEIITTSNFTVHLAGTLLKETNLLLPKIVGRKWYWCDEEKYSKWYPSVKKYIQEKDGVWDEPIKELAKDLKNKFKTN